MAYQRHNVAEHEADQDADRHEQVYHGASSTWTVGDGTAGRTGAGPHGQGPHWRNQRSAATSKRRLITPPCYYPFPR